VYISPTVRSASGHNATLWKFATSIGMTLNAGELEVPGGTLYQDGQSCEGKPGHVYVMTWSNPSEPQTSGVFQHKKSLSGGNEDTCDPDCDSGVLLEDDQLVTIAFLPAPPKDQSPDILQPPGSVISELIKLEDQKAATAAGETSTTVAVVPSTLQTTPPKGATTSTSAGKSTTSATKPTSTVTTTTTSASTSSTTSAKTSKPTT